jgi:hypothetical protein
MHSVSAEMRNIADGATVSNLDLDKVFGDLSKVILLFCANIMLICSVGFAWTFRICGN